MNSTSIWGTKPSTAPTPATIPSRIRLDSQPAQPTEVRNPSISTGIYGYPLEQASEIAVNAIREGLEKYPDIEEILMICFSESVQKAYQKAYQKMYEKVQ